MINNQFIYMTERTKTSKIENWTKNINKNFIEK